MKTLRTTYLIATALAIGLAGYWLGRHWLGRQHVSPPPSLPLPTKSSATPPSTRPSKPPEDHSTIAEGARELLTRAWQMRLGTDGEYAIKQFLHDLPAAQYAGFANQLTSLFPAIADQKQGHFILTEFARLWSRQDLTAALAWARGLPQCQEMVVDALASDLAETDAAAAIKLLAAERGGLDSHGALLMEKWARQDLSAARAALANMKGPHANLARMAVVDVWMEHDIQAAMA